MEQFKFLPNLFLHFFDTHFLELQARGRPREEVARECRLATRFGYLAADVLYVPAASYFESELCREIVDELHPVFECGFLFLVGGGANILEFVEEKCAQYDRSSPQHRIYFGPLPEHLPPYRNRTKSATKHIITDWRAHLKSGRAPELFEGTDVKVPRGFERRWERIPELLGGRAFILDHVRPHLLPKVENRTVLSRMQEIIDKAYFESFTDEYGAGVVRDLVYLETSHRVPSSGLDLSYRTLIREVRRAHLLEPILAADAVSLEGARGSSQWLAVLAATLASASELPAGGGGAPGGNGTPAVSGPATGSTPAVEAFVMSEPVSQPRIGIITALPKEFAAVEALLDNPITRSIPGRGAGRRYVLGDIPSSHGGVHQVVLALLPDMGNNIAAVRATLLLEHYPTVDAVIMTGIAGGVPNPAKAEDHVRLGDLVISNRSGVVQYDNLKSERKEDFVEDIVRAAPRAPSARLLEAVRYLDAAAYKGKGWESLIDRVGSELGFTRPEGATDVLRDSAYPAKLVSHPDDPLRELGRPRLFHGPIAASNTLLKDPIKRDGLRDRFGVKAVEMEGSGVADATWHQNEGYLVVRGICDYCDVGKGDLWQNYATAVAAGYTVALVQSMPK